MSTESITSPLPSEPSAESTQPATNGDNEDTEEKTRGRPFTLQETEALLSNVVRHSRTALGLKRSIEACHTKHILTHLDPTKAADIEKARKHIHYIMRQNGPFSKPYQRKKLNLPKKIRSKNDEEEIQRRIAEHGQQEEQNEKLHEKIRNYLDTIRKQEVSPVSSAATEEEVRQIVEEGAADRRTAHKTTLNYLEQRMVKEEKFIEKIPDLLERLIDNMERTTRMLEQHIRYKGNKRIRSETDVREDEEAEGEEAEERPLKRTRKAKDV
jgi:hypothetical protein